MLAQKTSRSVPSETPQKTFNINRRMDCPDGSESELATLKQPRRIPADRNPIVIVRQSSRSKLSEKKQPNKIADLERQLAQIEEDLRKTNYQLGSSETRKRRTQQEAEEAKKEHSLISAKVKGSKSQLDGLFMAEEVRLQELRKISHGRDRAWESELEAIQNKRSLDSIALNSAMAEIQKLKLQVDMVVKSEAAKAEQFEMACSELQAMEKEMAETVSLVESLKFQLTDSVKAEADVRAAAIETSEQLEMAKANADILLSDRLKLMESFSSLASELQESRTQVNTLEEVVRKLQECQLSYNNAALPDNGSDYSEHRKEIGNDSLESEVEQLKSALEDLELNYLEEQIKSMVCIQYAYQFVERVRTESGLRGTESDLTLKYIKAEIIELKASLYDKDRELRNMSVLNKKLSEEKTEMKEMLSNLDLRLTNATSEGAELKAKLTAKETDKLSILEENERLKSEIGKIEMENLEDYKEAVAQVELARTNEQEALKRLAVVSEEEGKSCKRAAMLAEQLKAAEEAKSEIEEEFRRVSKQSEQWRKAAEVAADILSTDNKVMSVDKSKFSGFRKHGKAVK